jgi:hypothetical protein
MRRTSERLGLVVVGVLALNCTTTQPAKDAPQAQPQTQATSLTLEKPKMVFDPNPTQTIVTAKNWLGELRGTDTKRLSKITGFPFYSYGLVPKEGTDKEACGTKEVAPTKEAFAETAACFVKNSDIRGNIPANLYVRSVFELKIVTLENAFADQPELKEILSHKKELEGKCCRTYVQGYFPGDKLNAYVLLAVEWKDGDVRVVGALSETDPIE